MLRPPNWQDMDRKAITKTIELVRDAQGGDEIATNRLIERYYERVRSVVRMRLGKKLRRNLDSGDIVQQTFLAAIQQFDHFEMRDEASLINWLAKYAERQITDEADRYSAKKRNVDRQVALDGSGSESGSDPKAFELPDMHTRPMDRAVKNEDRELMEDCMEELPVQYRELIVLRDYVGLSWEDIAKKTGSPSDAAARMKHAKAMLELSKILKQHGVEGQAEKDKS